MDYCEWVFVTDGRAIVIESSSLENATNHYMKKYSISGKPLHIIRVSGHDTTKKSIVKKIGD